MLAPQNAPKKEDFSLKEIKPKITGKAANTSGPSTTFDLVEQMQYLYVKFEKVRGLPPACHPYIEVNIGNYKATTRHLENNNQVFAFKRDKLQSNKVDILVKDKAAVAGDGTIGKFDFAVNEAQMRILPNSPFASQWVRLKDEKELKGAELLLAYWMGAQADGAFNEPYYADTASVVSGYGVSETHPKMYDFYYKLWYLRVNVIQAEDLVFRDMNNGKPREIFVKASVGRWVLRTKASQTKTDNPMWNEDLMFVVAEKFEEDLIVSVEEKVDNMGGSFTLGSCKIPLANVAKRNNAAAATAVKYNLEMMEKLEGKVKFASKIQMRVSLDGGYHVLDEPAHSISDYRPSAKALWKPKIGVLELGIISASTLKPVRPKNRVDAYCVAKYGPKWVKTRTVVDSRDPKWNEQYNWDVYDACTVITVAVFDNNHLESWDKSGRAMDLPIGKVKIRLSTLEAGKIYKNSFPLMVLQPSGLDKKGELQLVVRFSVDSMLNTLWTYTQPLMPKMHYLQPLSVDQMSILLQQAADAIALKLSKSEPPIRREVVDYVLDVKARSWSLRRARVNFERIVKVLDVFFWLIKKFDQARSWTNLWISIPVLVAFTILVVWPQTLIYSLIGALVYCVFVGIRSYPNRPKQIPHINTELSHLHTALPDVLDEELDPFPTRRTDVETLRRRYDRLRSIGLNIQTLLGDIATQGERVQSLLSWRDPRATSMFVISCVIAVFILSVVRFDAIVFLAGGYVLLPPIFRTRFPVYPQNLLRRMPAKTDVFV
ncbi:hypothetical protein FF1_005526 [Malus domestica]